MFTSAKELFETLKPAEASVWTQKNQKTQWPFLQFCLRQQVLHPIDVFLAEHLLKKCDNEGVAALICYLSLCARQGHLCIKIKDNRILPPICDSWPLLDSESVTMLYNLIIQGSKILAPGIFQDDDRYYLQRFFVLETTLINRLTHLLKKSQSESHKVHTPHFNHSLSLKSLTVEQAEAIKRGKEQLFTIITGGPGTGKTFTAGELLKDLWSSLSLEQQQSYKIELTAPTGKAAANLELSIQRAFKNVSNFPKVVAKTLHSLLKIKKNPSLSHVLLDADLIMIDECSMIDIHLMEQLLESIQPTTRLIFLGDPYQLMPVDTGSIFSDLVDFLNHTSSISCLTQLNTVLRSECQEIIKIAHHVKLGDEKAVFEQLNMHASSQITSLKYVPLHTSNHTINGFDIANYVLPFFPHCEHIPSNPSELLQDYSKFRLLTPLRQGTFGTDQLNQLFFSLVEKKSIHAKCFIVPIMITTNQHRLNLFNGEMGLLIKFHHNPSLDYALFPSKHQQGGYCSIPALRLASFEYAFCISVHKSQGSEFEHVLLLLPEGAESFGREALYTGITRAKQKLEIWSSSSTLKAMILKKTKRCSGITEKLTNNFK